MNTRIFPLLALTVVSAGYVSAQRHQQTLNEGWSFAKGEPTELKKGDWSQVRVPHDWAIYGPFDRANDLQTVAIEQNGETEETVKTGHVDP